MAIPAVALLAGGLGFAASQALRPKTPQAPSAAPTAQIKTTPDETAAQAEARIAKEQEEAGAKSSKQAAAFLRSRNARGFESNPNKARQFLLAL